MPAERYPHSLYGWALSTTWRPRTTFYIPASSRAPLRCRKPCMASAIISSDSTSDKDDAYRQFADMLGVSSPPSPQTGDSTNTVSADFADRLGLNAKNREHDDIKKSVAKLSPKKVEIDPEDYNIFDEMLERTGGRGIKPVKGSKPYSPHMTREHKGGMMRRNNMRSAPGPDANTNVARPESDAGSSERTGFFLSEEEKAQAYAVMMEEFGPGTHDGVETWTPDDDVDDTESPSPLLLKPPERPGTARLTEQSMESSKCSPSEEFEAQQTVHTKEESFILQAKPSRPIPDDVLVPGTAAQFLASDNDGDASDNSGSESSFKSSSVQLKVESTAREFEGVLQLRDERGAQNCEDLDGGTTQELKAPPARPAQGDVIPQHLLAEDGLSSNLRPLEINSEVQISEVPALELPQPRRPQEPPADVMVQGGPPKSSPRLGQRKQVFRKQGLRNDEPPAVLTNPLLVYQCD